MFASRRREAAARKHQNLILLPNSFRPDLPRRRSHGIWSRACVCVRCVRVSCGRVWCGRVACGQVVCGRVRVAEFGVAECGMAEWHVAEWGWRSYVWPSEVWPSLVRVQGPTHATGDRCPVPAAKPFKLKVEHRNSSQAACRCPFLQILLRLAQ